MTFTLTRSMLDLRFRSARLIGRAWLTDEYVRVRVAGPELEGFLSPGADDHMRLFFPSGPVASVEEMRAAPSREYTPFAWGENWLDIEFAIHGDEGIAAQWAATAPLGAEIGVGGPRGTMSIDGTPDAWLLAGDETAVPAMRRFAAAMPQNAVGRIIVEVPDAARELLIPAPYGVTVTHVYRGQDAGGTALAHALDALTAADRPEGDVFAFIASEQSIVKSGRALAIGRWGLSADRIVVKGYWKRGDVEFHAPH